MKKQKTQQNHQLKKKKQKNQAKAKKRIRKRKRKKEKKRKKGVDLDLLITKGEIDQEVPTENIVVAGNFKFVINYCSFIYITFPQGLL